MTSARAIGPRHWEGGFAEATPPSRSRSVPAGLEASFMPPVG